MPDQDDLNSNNKNNESRRQKLCPQCGMPMHKEKNKDACAVDFWICDNCTNDEEVF